MATAGQGEQINKLTKVATEFASDDYVVIAGNTNGTRRLPANKLPKKTIQDANALVELFGFSPNASITLSGGVGTTAPSYVHQVNGTSYFETPCSSGETFVVVGKGGGDARLYAFIDEDREILEVALVNQDGSNGIVVTAPADGFLCVNSITSGCHVYKMPDSVLANNNLSRSREIAKLAKTDIANVSSGYITTNGNFGSEVSMSVTSSTTFVYQVVDVLAGDRFFIAGVCGNAPRLWCFVDSNNKIVSKYIGAEGGTTEAEIDAPFDGKLIVNFNKNHAYSIFKIDISGFLSARETEKKFLSERVDEVSAVELKNWGLNSYYATNGAVGSSVTMTPTQGNMRSLVVSCKAGDKFIVKGAGGSSGRLWCFVDSSDKIVSQAAASVTSTAGVSIEAPVDGKLIVNSSNSASVSQVVAFVSSKIYPLYSKTTEDCKTLSLVEKTDWVNESSITTNVSYGAEVNLTPVATSSYRHMVVDCVAGDEVYVKANGGDAPRSWAYIDSSNKLVSGLFSGIAQSTLLKISAPVDGKLIVNDNINTPLGLVLVSNASVKQEMLSNLNTRVTAIENELPPNTIFEVGHELPNVSAYMENFDYSTTALEKTILEQVYTAFDSLVTDYPDYVSRVDAAEEAEIAYPEYANGYDGVPAYKMYMYKFVSSFVGAGNENGVNPKKKLFIIAGQHGDETAAPANAYIFAKKLCEASDENFFKLRTCYDVYIIPCVNGFGLHKLTRVNGNGVDLNRNYPISHWHVTGQPGDSNYSGASAGSEFETQVVCAMFNSIEPDIAIDHHNYSDDLGNQFYITGRQLFLTKLGYQFLEDCSFTFIKDLPEYFGTEYQLFKKNTASGLPARIAGNTDATADVWFEEAGAECCMTVEISRCINYYGGEAVSTGQGKDLYGESTFSVGQYTLSGILLKACGYIIGR